MAANRCVWCGLEQSIFDEASGKEDTERASMLKEDISSTAGELTMLILSISVIFSVTCLTVTSLITKSCSNVGHFILVHFTR